MVIYSKQTVHIVDYMQNFNRINIALHKMFTRRDRVPVSYTHLDVYKRQL